MRYLTFFLFVYMLTTLVYAGPEDRWVPVESVEQVSVEQVPEESEQQLDGIALLLAIGVFAWVYVIYRDFKGKESRK